MINLKSGFNASLVCLTLSLLMLVGCARTVTDRNVFLTLEITLNFEDTVNTSTHQYFFAVGSSEIKTPDPTVHNYFPTPGRTTDFTNQELIEKESEGTFAQGITFYYSTFFDSWSDYFVIKDNTVQLFKSNGTGFSGTTTEEQHTQDYPSDLGFQPETLRIQGNQIVLSFLVQDLSISPTNLFFNAFTTTPVGDGTETGNLNARLSTIERSIRLSAGQDSSLLTVDTSGTPPAATFSSWQVRVF